MDSIIPLDFINQELIGLKKMGLEIIRFIHQGQGCIKLMKSDSKNNYSVTKDFNFKC